MTTHLIFIRHAQSIWNETGRWQGQADPPLSENGLTQARMLAERLRRSWTINHLYTSDLVRAATTAATIGDALGMAVTSDPIWRERAIGEWEGLTTEEIMTGYPEAWAARQHGPMNAPGGETPEAVLSRASIGCNALLQRHADQTIAIVSHGGMILSTLVHLLGLPPAGFAKLVGGEHTAISQVTVHEGHARLIRLNDSAHLELLMMQPDLHRP